MKLLEKLTRQQKISLGLLLLLLVSLPVALFVSQKLQDIRPRADITHQVNFKLATNKANPAKGEVFTVNASMELEGGGLRASGVDFRILYDKNLLEANPTVTANAGSSAQPFTDVLLKEVDKPWDDELNYLRVVMVARKSTPGLKGGTIPLATITFKAKNIDGDATIKYPKNEKDENGADIMQVVGIDLGAAGITPTATPTTIPPTITPTATPTTIPPTATPSPTGVVLRELILNGKISVIFDDYKSSI